VCTREDNRSDKPQIFVRHLVLECTMEQSLLVQQRWQLVDDVPKRNGS
jgi:hypothetical protein